LKKIIILLVAVAFLSAKQYNEKPASIELSAALEKGLVNITITGNDESPHYAKPLLITISNLKNETIQIRIPNGQLFTSEDPEFQDIIVNKEELITLKPGESLERSLHGMCIQQSNGAPGSSSMYRLNGLAQGNLATLTREIEKSGNFNTLGQYAIWTLTDNQHLNNISGFDIKEAERLKTFVAGLLNVPVPEYDPNDYLTNYANDGLIKRSATGRFKYTFSEKSSVTIAMFDEDNIVVRELYNNPNETPGKHELEFKFDTEVYQNKAYYVRMIVDGEIKINMKMEPRGS
jgi:hypothetical protein